MRLNIRVGNILADMTNFNRLEIEELEGRKFLIGVRSSGARQVVFAVRPDREGATPNHDRVIDDLCRTIDGTKNVCVLHNELIDLADDPEAAAVVERHNAAAGAAAQETRAGRGDRPRVSRPPDLETVPPAASVLERRVADA